VCCTSRLRGFRLGFGEGCECLFDGFALCARSGCTLFSRLLMNYEFFSALVLGGV
jgi:hypothetical protein